MKWLKRTCLVMILMLPLTLRAAPHEPSPAGGGWLELNPESPLVQTEKPWFPDYPGPLTIEDVGVYRQTAKGSRCHIAGYWIPCGFFYRRSNRPIHLCHCR